ncbi:MAG: tetratricopeptide repeat protein, partial [Spirochaetota bacterium]
MRERILVVHDEVALLGDVDGAVADFRRSLRVTPEYERPAENLAQLLQAHPEVENASRILDSLAVRYRRNQVVQRARAENALGREDYPTAEDALEVLVDRDSKDRYALRMLGVLAYRRGDTGRAKKFFGRLEALHPPDRSYRKDVARIQLEAGKHADALATIEDYLRSEPEDLDGLVCRADILMEQEHHQEALDFLGKLSERFPESTRVLSRIAWVHRRMGDREEALDAADRLISLQGHRG